MSLAASVRSSAQTLSFRSRSEALGGSVREETTDMRSNSPLRILVDARVDPGASGGVGQVILGRAHGFRQLSDGNEEFGFLVHRGGEEEVRDVMGTSAFLIEVERPGGSAARRSLAAMGRKVAATTILHRLADVWAPVPPIPVPTFEIPRIDVIHFAKQGAFKTAIPNIYQPHDLQHVHRPDHFSRREVARRELWYRTFCRQATCVSVMRADAKRELATRYGVDPARIAVIGHPPSLSMYEAPTTHEVREVLGRLKIPDPFMLYPAKTWPHKNHLTLIAALGRLCREGQRLHVVFTGGETDFASRIRAAACDQGVSDLVHWLGYLAGRDLYALYLAARLVVFPSLFEGWGMPVLEALYAGSPLVCSAAVGFEEIAKDAAIYVDANSARSIAAGIRTVCTDEKMRTLLAARGPAIARQYSWASVARRYRSIYRLLGGRQLTPDDVSLLNESSLSLRH